MKGLSGNFLTNPYDKPPYWISVGIGAAYVMRPSWSLSCYITDYLTKLRNSLCNRHTAIITRPSPHGHRHTATAIRPPPHGHHHTATATRSPPHSHRHTATATQLPPRGLTTLGRVTCRVICRVTYRVI